MVSNVLHQDLEHIHGTDDLESNGPKMAASLQVGVYILSISGTLCLGSARATKKQGRKQGLDQTPWALMTFSDSVPSKSLESGGIANLAIIHGEVVIVEEGEMSYPRGCRGCRVKGWEDTRELYLGFVGREKWLWTLITRVAKILDEVHLEVCNYWETHLLVGHQKGRKALRYPVRKLNILLCLAVLPDENQILLKVPRKDNMYSFDMKNIVLKESLTCLVAKATLDESMLCHRRLGHINFKNINKLVKDNLKQFLLLLCTSRVLVVKPHNKTPYELFRGFKPALSFMRPFGYHVTILNTLDSLGKFDGKSDEGFFVGYSLSSKAFRVYNTRTKRVEENLHIGFLENKPMIEGTGPKWLFDIDSLTQSINYVPKDPPYFDSSTKNVENGEPKTADDTQKQDEDGLIYENAKQKGFQFDSSSKDVNAVGQQVNTTSLDLNTGCLELNAVGPSVSIASPNEEDNTKEEPEVDLGNITNSYIVPTTPNTRIHKDHLIDNVIGDVQSAFLYGTIEEKVYVTQPLGLKDPDHPDKVYKVVKALYGLHQAPRACTQKEDGNIYLVRTYMLAAEILKKFNYSDVKSASTPVDLEKPLVKDGDADDVDYVHVLDFKFHPKDFTFSCSISGIFRYLKGKPTLGLWYSRDSPFELVAYTDSDYAGATLDRKSTTRGCQFLGNRLISWQCKKQTVVATSTTEAEYVAAASCCGQVLWIQNQLLDYGYNFMNTVINIDNNQ
ncbi:ribonuclease H-like domain-containing protein [Tanacetum coccineum]